jgi:hypothetical protein
MKHIAFHHELGSPQQSTGAAWLVAASSALERLLHGAQRREARPLAASTVGRKQPAMRMDVAHVVAPPAVSTATQWQRRGAAGVPWVEGLVLALMIAFFGVGLVAILGGF